jgi:hypothetical protein
VTKVKALYVLQCREFILEQHGEAGIEAVKAQLAPAMRDQLYSPFSVATDWMDVGLALEHALAYDRAFGTGTGEAAERMLSGLVAKHYTVMYRSIFAQASSPEAVLEKSSRLWRRFYDEGDTQLIILSPTSVIKRITGITDFPARHELLLSPYYEELLRQWGAKDPLARHTKCVARGAECCETVISWRRHSGLISRSLLP